MDLTKQSLWIFIILTTQILEEMDMEGSKHNKSAINRMIGKGFLME